MNENNFDFDLNDLYEKLTNANSSTNSNLPVDGVEENSPVESTNSKRFPEMLYMLLQENNYPEIVSWSNDGRTFKIHNRKEFEEHILSSHFCNIKFRSFQRQLNIYGYIRLDKGVTHYTYGHNNFARDRNINFDDMKRIPIKSQMDPFSDS